MSELTATIHALFEVEEDCNFVAQGLELLASDADSASEYFAPCVKKKFCEFSTEFI